MEVDVSQAIVCHPIQRRRRNHSTERAGRAETHIVRNDQEYIGRALRRNHARRPPRLGLRRILVDHTPKLGIRRRTASPELWSSRWAFPAPPSPAPSPVSLVPRQSGRVTGNRTSAKQTRQRLILEWTASVFLLHGHPQLSTNGERSCSHSLGWIPLPTVTWDRGRIIRHAI